jgi:hypothetical protein
MTDAGAVLAPGIDTIMRCHDAGRLVEMDRALFSLLHQSYGPVHPIVVTQGFDQAQSGALRDIVEASHWLDFGHVTPTVVNVAADRAQDMRSVLLNVGIGHLRHRYFSILDSDDYLYGSAFAHLIEALGQSGASIAFGNIVRRDVRAFSEFVYTRNEIKGAFHGSDLADLLIENFCPIHSFVLDRRSVAAGDLWFNEALIRLEDYDFLLRLCAKYPASFTSRARTVGVYNWHLDGRASNPFGEGDEKAKANRATWNHARRHIWRLKRDLFEAHSARPSIEGGVEADSDA